MMTFPSTSREHSRRRLITALTLLLFSLNSHHHASSSELPNGKNGNSDLQTHPSIISSRRPLPARIIVGYTKHCDDSVINAVENGVNVVIWSFIRLMATDDEDFKNSEKATNYLKPQRIAKEGGRRSAIPNEGRHPVIRGGPDLGCVERMISELDSAGYEDVIHLVSFGGWDGNHLDTTFSADWMYQTWKEYGGSVFHGFDWDLEGNDAVGSPNNVFTLECLNRMGDMSDLAKKDGYIVSMAPAESYLDISVSTFSRFVNLTYPGDNWHPEFLYHGANVYAFLLAKWGDSIDFISIQLYETHSHAEYNITQLNASPSDYLMDYVSGLEGSDGEYGYVVDFDQDESVGLGRTFVKIPLEKLVIGLSTQSDYYISTIDAGIAYEGLSQKGKMVKGFMFWCIEGDGIQFASDLNTFMRIRS